MNIISDLMFPTTTNSSSLVKPHVSGARLPLSSLQRCSSDVEILRRDSERRCCAGKNVNGLCLFHFVYQCVQVWLVVDVFGVVLGKQNVVSVFTVMILRDLLDGGGAY